MAGPSRRPPSRVAIHQLGLRSAAASAGHPYVLGMRGQVEVQVVHVPHHDSDVHLLAGVRGLLGEEPARSARGICHPSHRQADLWSEHQPRVSALP